MRERVEGRAGAGPLQLLAREIRRRILLERLAAALASRSPWIGCGLLLVLLVEVAMGWDLPSGGVLGAALAVWSGLGFASVALRFPGEQAALLDWDARTGRKGALASAWEFERRRGELRVGERLHYEVMLGALEAARDERGFSWPRPDFFWAVLPLALVLVAGSGWRERAVMSQGQSTLAERVSDVARELAEWSRETPDPEVHELAEAVRETARRIRALAPVAAGGAPGELEERARQLEEAARTPGDPAQAPGSGRLRSREAGQRLEKLAEDLRRAAGKTGEGSGGGEEPKPLPAGPLPGAQPLAAHAPLQPLETVEEGAGDPAAGAPAPDPDPDRPPVPGMPSQVVGKPGGSAPVPGGAGLGVAALARQFGGSGFQAIPGQEAGSGRRELGRDEVAALQARREDRVEAARRDERGATRVRAVAAGEARPETVRAAEQVGAGFRQVEEAAQSGQPLPAERRAQVERYFRGIRQLE